MNKHKFVLTAFTALITGNASALTITPAYDGNDGIRAQVFTTCLTCHSSNLTGSQRRGAPVDVNFDTYEAAKAKANRAIVRAVDQASMPPSFSQLPTLNADQKAALRSWQVSGFQKAASAVEPSTGRYDFNTNTLTLDVVIVGELKYKATLKLVPQSTSPTGYAFSLTGAETVANTFTNAGIYSVEFGQVHLPKIDLVSGGSVTGSVEADLLLVKGSSPLLFTLGAYK